MIEAIYNLFSQKILILLLLAILLSGCAAPAVPPDPTSTATPAIPTSTPPPTKQPTPPVSETECSEIVRLRMDEWSNTPEAQAARDEVLAAFHAANPCIEVEAIYSDSVDPKRVELIKSGAASDLIASDSSYIPAYTEVGGLIDLTPFIEADPDFKPEEIYFQGVWKAGFYQGVPRAINKDFSTCAIYVNVGLFKQAGLPLPIEGWTYQAWEMGMAE